MFTGMRLNEIAQLETADIKQRDGIWVIDVSDVGEGSRKRLKTGAADRQVPLHDRLVATGFLDFVAVQRSRDTFWTSAAVTTGIMHSDLVG